MKKKVVLIVALLVLAISVGLFAADMYVKAKLTDIKVVMDGKALVLKDAKGAVLKPLSYNNSTYLPVRAISESLGVGVKWDAKTQTITLDSDPSDDAKDMDKNDGADLEKPAGAYEIGQKWVVPGQWEVTIDSVEETSIRNQYASKKPEAVYIINYTYKNIGYTGNNGKGLFITPHDKVIDSKGKPGYIYPLASKLNTAKATAIGDTCKAQVVVGVDNKGDFITNVIQYDSNLISQNMPFFIDVD